MNRKGRPEKIKPSELSILRELALEQPLAMLDELAFQSRTGLQVHSATLRKEKNFFEARVTEYQTGEALVWE
jgi:hypothetical protein